MTGWKNSSKFLVTYLWEKVGDLINSKTRYDHLITSHAMFDNSISHPTEKSNFGVYFTSIDVVGVGKHIKHCENEVWGVRPWPDLVQKKASRIGENSAIMFQIHFFISHLILWFTLFEKKLIIEGDWHFAPEICGWMMQADNMILSIQEFHYFISVMLTLLFCSDFINSNLMWRRKMASFERIWGEQ